MNNHMEICFDAVSINEGFARMAVAVFVAELDPTIEQIDDIKTAVSEAVTNSIIHGYGEEKDKKVRVLCSYEDRDVTIEDIDKGVGIADVQKAKEPLFTTKPELERSGMGFCFMEAFMDSLDVWSVPGEGTRVVMKKRL